MKTTAPAPSSAPRAPASAPPVAHAARAPGRVAMLGRVRYLMHQRIALRGSVSGRPYEFSAAAPVQSVDMRDVASLLRTRLFRMDG